MPDKSAIEVITEVLARVACRWEAVRHPGCGPRLGEPAGFSAGQRSPSEWCLMHAHSNVVSVGMCRYCGLRISRPAGSPTFYCLGCGREFATHTEHNAHVAQVITSLPDIAIVALPERVVNERGRDVVEGAGIQFAFTGDEFQLWVWNSVSGHTLQKRYDRSVGIDLPGLVLAAANAAEEVR